MKEDRICQLCYRQVDNYGRCRTDNCENNLIKIFPDITFKPGPELQKALDMRPFKLPSKQSQ